jgi:hypothetical protein
MTSDAMITRPKNGGLPASPGPGFGSGWGGVVGAGGEDERGTELLG